MLAILHFAARFCIISIECARGQCPSDPYLPDLYSFLHKMPTCQDLRISSMPTCQDLHISICDIFSLLSSPLRDVCSYVVPRLRLVFFLDESLFPDRFGRVKRDHAQVPEAPRPHQRLLPQNISIARPCCHLIGFLCETMQHVLDSIL